MQKVEKILKIKYLGLGSRWSVLKITISSHFISIISSITTTNINSKMDSPATRCKRTLDNLYDDLYESLPRGERPTKRIRRAYNEAKPTIKTVAWKTALGAGHAIRNAPHSSYRFARGISYAVRTVRAGYPRVPRIFSNFRWLPQTPPTEPIVTTTVPGAYPSSPTRSVETVESQNTQQEVLETTTSSSAEEEPVVNGVQDASDALPSYQIRPRHQRQMHRRAAESRAAENKSNEWDQEISYRSDVLRRLHICRKGPNSVNQTLRNRLTSRGLPDGATSTELKQLLKLCEGDPGAYEYIKTAPFPHIDPKSDYGKLYYAKCNTRFDLTHSRYIKVLARRKEEQARRRQMGSRAHVSEVSGNADSSDRDEEGLPYSPETADYFAAHSASDAIFALPLATVNDSPIQERQARENSNDDAADASASRPSSSSHLGSDFMSDVIRLADQLDSTLEPSPEWKERNRKIREAEAAKEAAKRALEEAAAERRRKKEEEARKKLEEEQEAKLEAARAAERERKRQEEIERKKALEIVRPLPEKENTALDAFLATKSDSSQKGKIDRRDLRKLLPQKDDAGNGWLNDDIINNYVGLVAAKARVEAGQDPNRPMRPKCHAFTSHMYSKWKSNNEKLDQFDKWVARAKLDGDGLLAAETIFIPINANSHWTLLTVNGTKRTITYFDSLGGKGSDYIRFARLWVKHTLGKFYKEEEWKVTVEESSRQMNGNDCGAFVCTNSLALAKGRTPTDAFDHTHIGNARRMIAATLMKSTIDDEFGW